MASQQKYGRVADARLTGAGVANIRAANGGASGDNTTNGKATNGASAGAKAVSARPAEEADTPFSWRDPHHEMVVFFVGDQTGNGKGFLVHKDLLCSKSSYYRNELGRPGNMERTRNLLDFEPDTFGFVQMYLYENSAFVEATYPPYDELVEAWRLGEHMKINGFLDEVTDVMTQRKEFTHELPSAQLLGKVWEKNPEGSGLRQLLISWILEEVQNSESKHEVTQGLPQQVLSELVVAMTNGNAPSGIRINNPAPVIRVDNSASPGSQSQRKRTYYRDQDDEDYESDSEPALKAPKRHSDSSIRKATGRPNPRASLPGQKSQKSDKSDKRDKRKKQPRSQNKPVASGKVILPEQATPRLSFCADLLGRMLSGPSYWTRIVARFKNPVRPIEDGVRDYLDVIKKPMDLGTMRTKLEAFEYGTHEEFEADMRQIIANCLQYWPPGTEMYQQGKKLEEDFNNKYIIEMPKWVNKREAGQIDEEAVVEVDDEHEEI